MNLFPHFERVILTRVVFERAALLHFVGKEREKESSGLDGKEASSVPQLHARLSGRTKIKNTVKAENSK